MSRLSPRPARRLLVAALASLALGACAAPATGPAAPDAPSLDTAPTTSDSTARRDYQNPVG